MYSATYYGHSGVKEAVIAMSSRPEYDMYKSELNTRQERREVPFSNEWGEMWRGMGGVENIEIQEPAEVTLLENQERQCLT